MSARANGFFALAALACFALGVVLSRDVEPGIRVEAVTLAGDVPALRFLPAESGPRPVALLAHGVTASKETLFRFGEALAAAGFVCFAVDLPGHGDSAAPFRGRENANTLTRVASTLGSVDIFLGHSMGAYAGAEAVRNGGMEPRLFIAVGALPDLGEQGPPLLLMAGWFEEAVPLARLQARTDARLVLSRWSDHALEPYDAHLVDAAVEAACATIGQRPPAPPVRWRLRLAGMVLGMLGALVLGHRLPELWPRVGPARGPLVSVLAIVAVASTSGTWLGAAPIARRAPLQLAAMAIVFLVVFGAGNLRIPRWSFAALAVAFMIGCAAVGARFLALFAGLGALVLLAGTMLGWIAACRGTRRDGDLALAIFVGYAIGQWVPRVL